MTSQDFMDAPLPSGAGADDSQETWQRLVVVTTTVADAGAADDLARALVVAKAAACVQSESITSYYEWDGILQVTPEWRLVCKTLPEVVPRLKQLLRELHPYEVPQLTVRTEQCLADYAQWLRQQVSATSPE